MKRLLHFLFRMHFVTRSKVNPFVYECEFCPYAYTPGG